jgi:hypothetical protein
MLWSRATSSNASHPASRRASCPASGAPWSVPFRGETPFPGNGGEQVVAVRAIAVVLAVVLISVMVVVAAVAVVSGGVFLAVVVTVHNSIMLECQLSPVQAIVVGGEWGLFIAVLGAQVLGVLHEVWHVFVGRTSCSVCPVRGVKGRWLLQREAKWCCAVRPVEYARVSDGEWSPPCEGLVEVP